MSLWWLGRCDILLPWAVHFFVTGRLHSVPIGADFTFPYSGRYQSLVLRPSPLLLLRAYPEVKQFAGAPSPPPQDRRAKGYPGSARPLPRNLVQTVTRGSASELVIEADLI